MLEKTLESSLDFREIESINPKGNQPWIFIGRIHAEAEAPIFWPPDAKNRLIGKALDVGKDWRQEEKGMTEGEIIWWHHWLNGHEFEQAPGDCDGQRTWGAPVHGVSPWLSDWTEHVKAKFWCLLLVLINYKVQITLLINSFLKCD